MSGPLTPRAGSEPRARGVWPSRARRLKNGRPPATFAIMSLRTRLKSTVTKVINKFSGEYSSAENEIRTPNPEDVTVPVAGAEVKVTRARLNRPAGGS